MGRSYFSPTKTPEYGPYGDSLVGRNTSPYMRLRLLRLCPLHPRTWRGYLSGVEPCELFYWPKAAPPPSVGA